MQGPRLAALAPALLSVARSVGVVGVVGLVALALAGCDRNERSDADQYWLDIDLTQRLTERGGRVLVGSEFGVRIDALALDGRVEDDQAKLDCATQTATGVLDELEPGRYRVVGAGPGAIEFAAPAAACPDVANLADLEPDSWSMRGHPAAGLVARWTTFNDTFVAAIDASPGPAGVFPEAFNLPVEHLRVAAGQDFSAVPTLLDPTHPRAEVRFNDDQASLTVPARYADLLGDPGDNPNQIEGSLGPGATLDLAELELLGQGYGLGPIEGVAVEHIEGLELTPYYAPATDHPLREWGPPAGVLAIARDGAGHRVVAAPVEWTLLRGPVRDPSVEGPTELATLAGSCREVSAPEWQSATLEARLGSLTATTELEWIAVPGDIPDEDCRIPTCNCSTSDARHGLGLLGLFGLLGLLRSRGRRNPRDRAPQTLCRT